MAYQPLAALVDLHASVCTQCGALVPPEGQQRHDAWHDFVDASLTGLSADLATLTPPPPPSGAPR